MKLKTTVHIAFLEFLLILCAAFPVNMSAFGISGQPDSIGGIPIIKVGLALGVRSANLDAIDELELRQADTGALVRVLPAGSRWNMIYTGAALLFSLSGRLLPGAASITGAFSLPVNAFSLAPGYMLVPAKQDGLLGLDGRSYRGAVWLRTGVTLSAINCVSLEDYLLSVVPSEMPSSWPLESLKAQAIAARSYALSSLGQYGNEGYDLKATTEDQVYSGVSSESPASNLAVAATAGIVLKNQGKVVRAYYHSTSGGSTESAEYVWGKSLPYLHRVFDYDDASPKFVWSKRVPVQDLEQALRSHSRDVGQLRQINPILRAPSNRNVQVLVSGSSGNKVLTGEEARGCFSLPSSNFNVFPDGNAFIFSGRGFGHGLGLSQWGAKALAERGYNAAQILGYYYNDVLLAYP